MSRQIVEVSEILDAFDLNEITDLVKGQINDNNNTDDIGAIITDHFKPLFYKYKKLVALNEDRETLIRKGVDEEVYQEAIDRFNKICWIFIDAICKKFNLELDEDWVSEKPKNLIGFTLALYSFFIIDFQQNVTYVTRNYLIQNLEHVYEVFESCKMKKDASTLVNKKELTTEQAIIISNIYDVVRWVLDEMDEDAFFEYFDDDYMPLGVIKALFTEGRLNGDFMSKIREIVSTSLTFNGRICFDIASALRKLSLDDSSENKEDK